MKIIEIDEALYCYIASHTRHIGESASEILRRMLNFTEGQKTLSTPESAPALEQIKQTTNAKKAHKERESEGSLSAVGRTQAVRTLLTSQAYLAQNWTVNRFLLVLSALYHVDSTSFTSAISTLHGRKRLYFAQAENILLENGQQTKPKPIPKTPYWVITNTNHNRKRSMLEQIMAAMQFPTELINTVCDAL